MAGRDIGQVEVTERTLRDLDSALWLRDACRVALDPRYADLKVREAMLAAGGAVGLWIGRNFNIVPIGNPPKATAVVCKVNAPVVVAGVGNQTSKPFFLVGGTRWASHRVPALYALG